MNPSAQQLTADWTMVVLLAGGWALCLRYGVVPGRFLIRRRESPRLFLFGMAIFGLVVVFALVMAILATLGLL